MRNRYIIVVGNYRTGETYDMTVEFTNKAKAIKFAKAIKALQVNDEVNYTVVRRYTVRTRTYNHREIAEDIVFMAN